MGGACDCKANTRLIHYKISSKHLYYTIIFVVFCGESECSESENDTNWVHPRRYFVNRLVRRLNSWKVGTPRLYTWLLCRTQETASSIISWSNLAVPIKGSLRTMPGNDECCLFNTAVCKCFCFNTRHCYMNVFYLLQLCTSLEDNLVEVFCSTSVSWGCKFILILAVRGNVEV